MLDEEIVEDVKWIQKETSISSLRDLVIGYMVGLLRSSIAMIGAAKTTENYEKVERIGQSIIKQRLHEIIDNI